MNELGMGLVIVFAVASSAIAQEAKIEAQKVPPAVRTIRLRADLTGVEPSGRDAVLARCATVLHDRFVQIDRVAGKDVRVDVVGEKIELSIPSTSKFESESSLEPLLRRVQLEFRLVARSDRSVDVEAQTKRFEEMLERTKGKPSDADLSAMTIVGENGVRYVWHRYRAASRPSLVGDGHGFDYELLEEDPGSSFGNADLEKIFQTTDSANRPAIGFKMREGSAQRFLRFTTAAQSRKLAIVVDGEVFSAPQVTGSIGASGVIDGGPRGFTTDELLRLIAVFESGSLPVRLEIDAPK